MARKRWTSPKLNKEMAAELAAQYGIEPIPALLLLNRGYRETPDLEEFFLDESELQDPFELPDMEKAVDRINEAIFSEERICVYGDYDCDGVTATALLYTYLEMQGADVVYVLPDRRKDGYGLNKSVVHRIKEMDCRLIVTVDNGIAAVEEADEIYALGMELIVTDHHLPGEILPKAEAVVDPHRTDVSCSYQDYCGAGIALQLCCAIEGTPDHVLEDLSDLAAIGTVADMVPLTGQNRIIVKQGLRLINQFPRPGIEALMKLCNLEPGSAVSTDISFRIGPRINAAGRMASPDIALDLLLVEDPEEADRLAEEVELLNQERHQEEERIVKEANAYLSKHPDQAYAPVLVVAGEGWHEGVLGIVASKLLEQYLRPVIVLGIRDGIAKGSARSIAGFSIFDAISSCSSMLTNFGGHELAAGLGLNADRIDEFRDAINTYADQLPVIYPEKQIDLKLLPGSLSLELLDSLSILEPYGMQNQSPIFGLYRLTIDNITPIGEKKDHRRLTLHRPGRPGQCTVLFFRCPDFPYKPGDEVDLIVTIHRNLYNGNESVSVFADDIRPSGADDEAMVEAETLYDRLIRGKAIPAEKASEIRPDRKVFATVYSYLRKNKISAKHYEYLSHELTKYDPSITLIRTMVALQAMQELGLLQVSSDGYYELPEMESKVDLNEAPILWALDTMIQNAEGDEIHG